MKAKYYLDCKRVVLGPAVLYLGDAAKIVPTLPEVDLLATDPPWGIGFQSNFRKQKFAVIHGDRGEVDVTAILTDCVHKLRDGRHAYVVGPKELFAGIDALMTKCELVWDKERTGMGDLSIPWAPSHEPIHFCVKRTSKVLREAGRGNLAARLRQHSILSGYMRGNGINALHPNEKPVPLMRRIVESSSNQNELVLDPFMGSASTVIAAITSGRRAIGIEIDEGYFEKACERVRRILPLLEQLESA